MKSTLNRQAIREEMQRTETEIRKLKKNFRSSTQLGVQPGDNKRLLALKFRYTVLCAALSTARGRVHLQGPASQRLPLTAPDFSEPLSPEDQLEALQEENEALRAEVAALRSRRLHRYQLIPGFNEHLRAVMTNYGYDEGFRRHRREATAGRTDAYHGHELASYEHCYLDAYLGVCDDIGSAFGPVSTAAPAEVADGEHLELNDLANIIVTH